MPSIVIHEYFWAASKLGIDMEIILAKIDEYLEDRGFTTLPNL